MSRFLRPNRPTQWKDTTYECGSVPIGEAHVQFRFQYYLFAIIFVVFDLVATFLLVWTLAFSGFTAEAKMWGLVFLGILLVGVAYALKKEEFIWI
ncbi:MAG: NADH-quinone oxidoreductase subunit A [Thermoplasmatales archaeon]|nr:NADH-quinone oxidoreductase subunit A [Thermoplasmatales archaeon]